MQHHVHEVARGILARASFGIPRLDRFGLAVVPLTVAGGAAPLRAAGGVVASELDRPRPDLVEISNRSRRVQTLSSGQILAGGWADRVVVAPAVVLPARTVRVRVGPLSPRWWNEGSLRLAGKLEPALAGLLMLVGSDRVGLHSVAQTALWDAYNHGPAAASVAEAQGWVLLDGSTVLAGCLVAPRSVPWVPAGLESEARGHLPGGVVAGALLADGVVRSLHVLPDRLVVSAVRASRQLVDVMCAATVVPEDRAGTTDRCRLQR